MKKVMLEKIKSEPALFLTLADKDKTFEICEFAVSHNGLWISEVPDIHRTEALILKAITNESHALQFVEFEGLRGAFLENIAMLAISYTPTTLNYVPFHYQTPRMVATACERMPMALAYVAEHLKTPELCKQCLEREVKTLKFIPEEHLNNEWIDDALKRSPWAIGDIPTIYQTKDRLEKAITKSGQVLKVIDPSRHSEHLYTIAFKQDPMSICHMINDGMRNRAVGAEIAREWPFDFEYEPLNPLQAEKFLRSDRAKHQPHLALAYQAYLSLETSTKPERHKIHGGDRDLDF